MVAGLLLPPLVAAGLWYGVGDLTLQAQQSFRISWIAVGVLAATAIVLAFLAGSRLSPVASLLGGLAFTAIGVMPFVEMVSGVRLLPTDLLPAVFRNGFTTSAYSGLLIVVGVTLLVASLFPSRWRGPGTRPGRARRVRVVVGLGVAAVAVPAAAQRLRGRHTADVPRVSHAWPGRMRPCAT
ncbi:hypothetical protein GCM10020220_036110 [Nonomuraea rubra]